MFPSSLTSTQRDVLASYAFAQDKNSKTSSEKNPAAAAARKTIKICKASLHQGLLENNLNGVVVSDGDLRKAVMLKKSKQNKKISAESVRKAISLISEKEFKVEQARLRANGQANSRSLASLALRNLFVDKMKDVCSQTSLKMTMSDYDEKCQLPAASKALNQQFRLINEMSEILRNIKTETQSKPKIDLSEQKETAMKLAEHDKNDCFFFTHNDPTTGASRTLFFDATPQIKKKNLSLKILQSDTAVENLLGCARTMDNVNIQDLQDNVLSNTFDSDVNAALSSLVEETTETVPSLKCWFL